MADKNKAQDPSAEDVIEDAIDGEITLEEMSAAMAEEAGEPDMETRIGELEADLAKANDRMLRALADADNTRRRAEKEARDARVFSIEKFAGDMLGVVDNLSRALDAVDEATRAELSAAGQGLLDGVELTHKGLLSALERHGVVPVAGKGEKFNPAVHQAVAQIPSQTPKGHVAEVMQDGFKIGERTLRAAVVAVSTGPAKAE